MDWRGRRIIKDSDAVVTLGNALRNLGRMMRPSILVLQKIRKTRLRKPGIWNEQCPRYFAIILLMDCEMYERNLTTYRAHGLAVWKKGVEEKSHLLECPTRYEALLETE